MIPRPRTEGAARYDPGRWICNKRPEKCDGSFRVYGQDMKCPIRARCFWGRRNTYQWTPGSKTWGWYLDLATEDREAIHGRRRAQLRDAFCREEELEAGRRYREAHREELAARDRLRRKREAPPPAVKTTLPCGEDCENCPYDACLYTDRDTDQLEADAAKERARRQSREKYRRQKAREAVDPAYAAKRKAQDAARCKRYYEAHRDTILAKAREYEKKRYYEKKGRSR